MIEHLPLLSEQECVLAVAEIYRMRSHWLDRSVRNQQSFFTLGRAAYLDVCLPGSDANAQYYSKLEASNATLREGFGFLYERILNAMTGLIGNSVDYGQELAMPGFHLFFGSGIVSAGEGGSHFDIQYSALRLPEPIDPVEPISFTLALQLPTHGSGLETWNITEQEFNKALARGLTHSLEEYRARKIRAFHTYRTGWLFIHRGLILHRLCSPGPILSTDARITLQGHGLRIRGRWILYW